jgi:O-antigen ligase
MESVATRSANRCPRVFPRVDVEAVSAWTLAGAIVFYLAVEGGGYDSVVRGQVGIVVWWIVLIGAAWGLLPATRFTRPAWGALALFGGFAAWTALASTWSLSSERSLQELARVACYLGILILAVAVHRDRERAVRRTIHAVATAVVAVACLALASRLRPDLFPGAQQTSAFLPGTESRLGWPLNYWNALAALTALGLPLLLAIATSARTLRAQAAAAAAIPILVLCGYLTFSRGGAIAAAAAVIVFFALSPERIPKLATVLVTAAGSAALIAAAAHRAAIEHGLAGAAAQHQGNTLLVSIVLVCAGVALAQAGIGLACRHGTPPRWLVVSRARAQWLLLAGVTACIVIALLVGAPARISHAWQDFKRPGAAALRQYSIERFGTASGNGRYDYWNAAAKATGGDLLGGSGPGTFQLVWLPRAPYFSYVENAHSLYLESLAEVGLVGLGLLVAFFALVVGAAVALVARSRDEPRVRAAGLAAALVAFLVAAGSDWVWQVPVLPAAFLLLAAAALAPQRVSAHTAPITRAASRWAVRVGGAAVALACLVAIAVPLATAGAVRRSQAAAASGDRSAALTDARTAARLEPGAASPQVQLALVLELQGDVRDALIAARRATSDEPANWSAWLLRSRLDAEAGRARASLAAYRRARSLNPRSPLFAPGERRD